MSIKVSSGITFPAVTGTFTLATLTLAGHATIPALAASDGTEKRLAIFVDSADALYYGFIESFTAPTTLVFKAGAGLPTGDKTTKSLIILDTYDGVHSYQDFLDEVESLVQDDASKLSAADKAAALDKAVTDWGKDKPLLVKKSIVGNATNSYLLTTLLSALWKAGYSQIFSIEYPSGDVPASLLVDDDFEIYDDGSAQDYSNLKLRFTDDQPSASQHFIVEFSIEPKLPSTGLMNFPDTKENFSAVTTLAAAYECQRLAAVHAQSADATISADVVNYHDKSAKYTKLAGEYKKQYNRLVFGNENPGAEVVAGFERKEMTMQYNTENQMSSSGGIANPNFLFHRRRR